MDFYQHGVNTAFEKLGLLKELGTAAKGAWGGLSGGAQQAVKRMGVGAGAGAVGGGVMDTPGGMLGGAVAGAGMGLGAHKGLQYLKGQGGVAGLKQKLQAMRGVAGAGEQQAAAAPAGLLGT